MSNSEAGKSLQTLPQLQATGAKVVGSDGGEVGDLGEVRDDSFTVTGRGFLKGNLNISVERVAEISTDESRLVLDIPADEAKDSSLSAPSGGDPQAAFSEDVKVEHGAWGMSHRKND